jgi:protein-arginine kinase activator protein McsA
MKSATVQEQIVQYLEEYIICPHCHKRLKPVPKSKKMKCWLCKKFFAIQKNPDSLWNQM